MSTCPAAKGNTKLELKMLIKSTVTHGNEVQTIRSESSTGVGFHIKCVIHDFPYETFQGKAQVQATVLHCHLHLLTPRRKEEDGSSVPLAARPG